MTEGKFEKADRVGGDTAELEEARPYQEKLQDLGRSVVASLHMLVRNVKLYGPENSIFERPMQKLRDNVNTIIALDGKLHLQCAGSTFYLNDMLMRIESKHVDSIRYLHEEFERCDVGGFVLDKSVNLQEIQNFIYIFGKECQERPGQDGVEGRKLQAFRLRSFALVREILDRQQVVDTDARLDRARYAMVVWARVMRFMDHYLAGLRGEGPQVSMALSRKLLQDLVDVCHGHKSHFLGLTTVRRDTRSQAHHAVNTAVLAVVFGVELALPKEKLRDLATAALFHDVGKAELDPELVAKRGDWTEDESRALARAPLASVRRLVQTRRLDMVNMHAIAAAFDHQTAFGKPLKDLEGKVIMVEPEAELTVFTKIVAVCESYESLTQFWGYTSEDALRLMSTEWLHRFDPVYVRILGRVLADVATRILDHPGDTLSFFGLSQS